MFNLIVNVNVNLYHIIDNNHCSTLLCEKRQNVRFVLSV